MEKLTSKVKSHSTEMLIEMFKELANVVSHEADIVNEVVMKELEQRMPEKDYIKLIDEVYED